LWTGEHTQDFSETKAEPMDVPALSWFSLAKEVLFESMLVDNVKQYNNNNMQLLSWNYWQLYGQQ